MLTHNLVIVIARHVTYWEMAPRQTASIYAHGLIAGRVAPVTNIGQWPEVPAALGRVVGEEHEADGFRWALDADAWQIGIGSIHGLAHGVIECIALGERYGTPTALHMPWDLDPDVVHEAGLTMSNISAAFAGDLLAAAAAFLRAEALTPW